MGGLVRKERCLKRCGGPEEMFGNQKDRRFVRQKEK